MEQTNNNLDYTNTMSMIRLCMVEGSKRSEHTRNWLLEHKTHAKRYHINVTGSQEHNWFNCHPRYREQGTLQYYVTGRGRFFGQQLKL